MTDQEYFDCKFITEDIAFYTIVDFYEKSRYLKAKINKMDSNQIYLYKWYLYANTHVNVKTKDLMWEYLTCRDFFEEASMRCKLRELYIQGLRKMAKDEESQFDSL